MHGRLPYLAAWEYKPPGLFAYLAFALALTGERATLAIAGLATASTFATALLLWRLTPLLDGARDARSGRYAALFYVLFAPENEGFLGDAEVLLAPFATAAILLACGEDVALSTAAVAGLLGGCALQMKLSALPIVALPMLVLARHARRPRRAVAAYFCAALAPFVLEAALYARADALPAFLDANVGATLRRTSGLRSGILSENLGWFFAQLRIYAPAFELALVALPAVARRQRLAAFGWPAAALASIVGIGEFYDRQFVLTQAPIALLGGIGLRATIDYVRKRFSERGAALVLAVVFLATFALHDYWETAQALTIAYHRAILREPAYRAGSHAEIVVALRALRPRSLFVIQESPTLYDELAVASPTRYAYTDHLLDARLAAMTGVPGPAELQRIFARHPAVVVAGSYREPRFDRAAVSVIERRLRADYHPVKSFASGTTIYVRDRKG